MKKAIVIGSGFAGLSAATCLASEGFDVAVFEKNQIPGGRARKFSSGGFVFDMGPSWYWMPDVFEKFFQRFGKHVSDYYDLKRLDPSYRVYYGKNDFFDIPAGIPGLYEFFERVEPGSAKRLQRFLEEGAFKYSAGIGNLVYKPGLSWREFADPKILSGAFRFHLFQSHSNYIRKFFRHPRLIGLLEFPVLFLGAPPQRIPALYSLMNYADMALGTWYPVGGMYTIIEGMVKLAREFGVKFHFERSVSRIAVNGSSSIGVWSENIFFAADYIVAAADYQHVEKTLLPKEVMQYSDHYWDTRTLAPSCLIFYLGVNKKIRNLLHHTLFFDEDIETHLMDIFDDPRWPVAPQFYVCCPSKTDPTVAPDQCENLFILIPVSTALKDHENIREQYFQMVIKRMENLTGEVILPHIVFKRSYAHNDFVRDYNAFKGNAYGLANTLLQTSNLKPRIANKNVSNLFYAGQFTVPGPGVPPSIISGQVAAEAVIKSAKKKSKTFGWKIC